MGFCHSHNDTGFEIVKTCKCLAMEVGMDEAVMCRTDKLKTRVLCEVELSLEF